VYVHLIDYQLESSSNGCTSMKNVVRPSAELLSDSVSGICIFFWLNKIHKLIRISASSYGLCKKVLKLQAAQCVCVFKINTYRYVYLQCGCRDVLVHHSASI